MSLKELCRACLCTGRIMSSLEESIMPKVDSPSNYVVEFWKIIKKMLITYEDSSPNEICNECLDEIQRTYFFIHKCERSKNILKKVKTGKIYLNRLKMSSVLFEPKNIKSENDIYPNILQTATGNFEWNHDYRDRKQFESGIHANINSSVDRRLQQKFTIQHEDCENDGTNEKVSVTQEIKQEPELDINVESDKFDEIDSEDKSSIEIFICPTCFFECRLLKSMEEHLIEDHMDGQICKLCSEEFKCTPIEHCLTHLYRNKTKEVNRSYIHRYKCKQCPKLFEWKSLLKKHLVVHTDERPFKCEICSKTFRYKNILTRHSISHTKERPFKCELCWKTFPVKRFLTLHLRCHTEERPFKCEVCTKTFKQKNYLTKHFRLHTGEEALFKCEICPKSFEFKSNLTEHIRCHTGERPFKCEVCPKSFGRKDNCTRHLKDHAGEKPFKCKICSQTFRQKCDLKRHLTCHTEERPFKCKICLKTFRHKRNLMVHFRFHTTERLFNCDICSKTYENKWILTEHLRCHTGERTAIQL